MSTAVDGDGDNEEELATAVRFVVQTICPLASDKTRSDVLVMAREGNEELELPLTMIGVARLATQTTVRRGMLLYHMPRCSFAGVELDGAKKPKAKSPPSEMTAAPGESGLPETIRSSAAHNAGDGDDMASGRANLLHRWLRRDGGRRRVWWFLRENDRWAPLIQCIIGPSGGPNLAAQ
jgi:hypothetical protein